METEKKTTPVKETPVEKTPAKETPAKEKKDQSKDQAAKKQKYVKPWISIASIGGELVVIALVLFFISRALI